MMETLAAYVHFPYYRKKTLGLSWLFCAWVAYPDQKQDRQRQDFHEALGAYVYKAQGKHAPDPLRRFKKTKVNSVLHRGLVRIGRRQLAVWVYAKSETEGVSVNTACTMATDVSALTDYDAEKSPDELQAIWPNADDQCTPETNVRRAFYEALPVLPMYLAMPVVSGTIRGALFYGLEGIDLPTRSIQEAMFSEDWLWLACRDANRIADQLKARFPDTVFLRPHPERL
jgi:hypothetical protein